jgi:LysR family transcriptional regulator, glycine cleavage system transcriptional activator
MRKLPPLTQLRAFEAAARLLSFKQAAFELGLTPTAISHQIKLLEQHVGRPLFRRQPRPLELTSTGKQILPPIRDGFDAIAEVFGRVRPDSGRALRVTATNAFAARWFVPRLPKWREAHPRVKLDIIGTDALLDVESGDVDIAIRYARNSPVGASVELMRDTFHLVASPKVVGKSSRFLTAAEIVQYPLIEAAWPLTDPLAPTWRRWQMVALGGRKVPDLAAMASLTFQEELHAIEAAVSGQGIAICSDVLIGPELASGALVPVSGVTLSGYGFYIVHRPGHRKLA